LNLQLYSPSPFFSNKWTWPNNAGSKNLFVLKTGVHIMYFFPQIIGNSQAILSIVRSQDMMFCMKNFVAIPKILHLWSRAISSSSDDKNHYACWQPCKCSSCYSLIFNEWPNNGNYFLNILIFKYLLCQFTKQSTNAWKFE
jgi:hypothetical protein